MDATTLWYTLAAALIIIGLLGTILPVLPGLPVMFAGMWVAAWVDDYTHISVTTLVVLGVLVLLSIGVDLLSSLVGAQRAGASRKGMFGAGVGSVVGLFFGLPGLIAGPLLGAAAGEMAHGRDWNEASRIGLGTWIGLLLGAILKLALAFAMLGLFALALIV